MGVEGDVAHQHEIFVAAYLGEGALQHVDRARAIAAVELVIGVDHAPGRVAQALAVGVVAGIGDERAHRRERLLARGLGNNRLGSGADVIGKGRLLGRSFGPGLDDSVHRGLSVRPTSWAGGVTGAAASVIRALGDSTHARRPDAAFPFYMASEEAFLPVSPTGRNRPRPASR